MDFNWNTSKLRGRIIEKFGTLTKFAEHINRTNQFVSKVLNNKSELTRDEMERWIDALDILPDEINPIFFIH